MFIQDRIARIANVAQKVARLLVTDPLDVRFSGPEIASRVAIRERFESGSHLETYLPLQVVARVHDVAGTISRIEMFSFNRAVDLFFAAVEKNRPHQFNAFEPHPGARPGGKNAEDKFFKELPVIGLLEY